LPPTPPGRRLCAAITARPPCARHRGAGSGRQPEEDLAASLALAARQPLVKGFAVGRTIFAEAGAGLAEGRDDRRQAVEDDGRRNTRAFARSGTRRARQGDGSMSTIRLTAAQAMVKWLSVQMTPEGERFIEGVWAIFGHGNVAGLGEALHAHRRRAAHLARPERTDHGPCGHRLCQGAGRRRAMAVTSSIGPGATNMVTAAALAHVNRLPVLLRPRRCLCQPRPRSGAAADRGFRRRHRHRPTTASARWCAISTASAGPNIS
jgi:hypothetical protein